MIRFTHHGQPNMFVEVVLASRHAITGRMVYTLHLRYPRIIHGEVMTHRVFNRNARSSRAVPVKTMLAEIRGSACFIPWHWTRNQSGMQGAENFTEEEISIFRAEWVHDALVACDRAEHRMGQGLHKQIANRPLEAFMWMDLLVTSTHWANFLHLRDHDAAEPHVRDLAVLVGQALNAAADFAQVLYPGQWHLPYVTREEMEHDLIVWRFSDAADAYVTPGEGISDIAKKISSARCARISYKPFDGNGSFEKELERYGSLVGNDAVHASPLEHQCSPDEVFDEDEDGHYFYAHPELHGSLTGFVQFRKTVPNEAIHD